MVHAGCPLLGPLAVAELDAYRPRWRDPPDDSPASDPEIIDLYGIRDALAEAFWGEGIEITAIPGITNPREWKRYTTLREAQRNPCGTVFVSCFSTSTP